MNPQDKQRDDMKRQSLTNVEGGAMTNKVGSLPKHTFECQDFECICGFNERLNAYITQQQHLLLDRVLEEVIGEKIQSDFDHDAGFCQNCDFEPTDGTENCLCKIVSEVRKQQRQAIQTIKESLK